MKKIAIIAGVVLVISFIGVKLAMNKETINKLNKPVDRSSVKVPVTVSAVFEAEVTGSFILPAVVKPAQETHITLTTSGKIKSLLFDLGTSVTKGQVIGTLDSRLKQINLESAELLMKKTKSDYDRIKDLYQGKAATEVDLNNSKYAYENARAQVDLIKQQISDGDIISPVSGVITRKNLNEGEFVNAGVSIATVTDISTLKSSVMVSEKDVYRLKTGMPVSISTDVFPEKTFKGNIRYISPSGNENHTYEVEVTFQNTAGTSLKAGTFIRVQFDLNSQAVVMQIPKLALVEGTKNPLVYVAENDKPILKKIVLGRDLGENIEVIEGLELNEKVITSGQINLTENSLIEVVNNISNQ